MALLGKKSFLLLFFLVVGISVLVFLFNYHKRLKNTYEDEWVGETDTESGDYEVNDWYLETDGELAEDNYEIARREQAETYFLLRNKDRYELSGGRFILMNCCFSLRDDLELIGYDFLLENPLGSGNFDDFGASSYINFDGKDTIKNFNVVKIGGGDKNPIYKIIIDSSLRHSEGIVYPYYDEEYAEYFGDEAYGVNYERLYEVKGDLFEYRASIAPTSNGYKVTVTSTGNSEGGEYILTKNGGGYGVSVVKDVNLAALEIE